MRLYVEALNQTDLDGMLALSGRAPELVAGAEARLRRWGGTGITLEAVEIRDGATPVQGIAQLRGRSSNGVYVERLGFARVDGRWLVAVSSWFGATPYP